MPTCTILHPQLYITVITDIHEIPKSVCNRTQAKQSISRHHICLTDSNLDYILEEIDHQEKFEYERDVEVLSDDEEISYDHFK